MQSKAATVEAYLKELPEDRRRALEAVRAVILKNLPKGYAEGMQYGMIGYFVPHEVYPAGYHCDPKQPVPFAGLASQKNYMSIYLMCIYGAPEREAWFRDAWAKTGKKLDMGKGCVRFKRIEDVPLNVIGQAIKRVPVKKFLEHYENTVGARGERAPSKKKSLSTKKSASKKAAPKKKTARKKTKSNASTRKMGSTARTAKKKSATRTRRA